MTERAPHRRLVVNPEPLKIVEARAGEKRPAERVFVICTVTTVAEPKRIRRISIHRKGCAHISLSCDREAGSSDRVSKALAEADSHGAQQAISCRGCGGWTVT